jgi:hypothetical protein
LIGLPAQVARDRSLAWPPDDDEDEDALKAAALVQTWVQPDKWIVTDSLTLAFHANRDVPPELVNTSSMRIKTGQLTTAQAITWTEQYQPAAIIFWDDRLEDLPGYAEWVEQRYRLVKKYGKERRVMLSTLCARRRPFDADPTLLNILVMSLSQVVEPCL